MKRGYLFLLLTLVTFFSSLPIGQAKAMEDYSNDYWTLDEIVTLREAVKQEILDYCQYSTDPDCMDRYHTEEFSGGDTDYLAVDNINAFRFLITAINPAKNSVRLMFIEDDMINTYATGELINDDIDELYMVWFDVNFLDDNFYYEYQSDTLPLKTHLLFAKDNLAGSLSSKEEITYELDSDVSLNNSNMIYYHFITTSGNAYLDPIDYNSCINHPYYHDGVECRLFFDKNNGGDFVYLPIEIIQDSIVEPETPIESNDETLSIQVVEPEIEVQASESEPRPTIIPLTPNTGAENLKCERIIELPWWMIILIAIGEILTIWCLLPNYQKNRQNRKKS